MGLVNFIQKLTNTAKAPPFDASVFGHPLAVKTEWGPKAGGGANFKTRTLKKVSNSELHYSPSKFGKIFAMAFMAFPLIFIGIAATSFMSQGFQIEMLAFIIIPLLFIGIGLFVLKKFSTTTVLDKGSGYFYKGKKNTLSSLNIEESDHTFKLSTIKALQVIPERVRGKNSSYTSYEINFIFEDGNRYNIVDHGHRTSIEEDARIMSDFLGIPLWNKMTGTSYLPQNTEQSSSYDSLAPDDRPEEKSKPLFSDPARYTTTTSKSSRKSSSRSDLDEPYDSTKPREL